MSRSQKNVRLGIDANDGTARAASGTPKYPADVTKKDGAANIAGDVNAFSTDDYKSMHVARECCD